MSIKRQRETDVVSVDPPQASLFLAAGRSVTEASRWAWLRSSTVRLALEAQPQAGSTREAPLRLDSRVHADDVAVVSRLLGPAFEMGELWGRSAPLWIRLLHGLEWLDLLLGLREWLASWIVCDHITDQEFLDLVDVLNPGGEPAQAWLTALRGRLAKHSDKWRFSAVSAGCALRLVDMLCIDQLDEGFFLLVEETTRLGTWLHSRPTPHATAKQLTALLLRLGCKFVDVAAALFGSHTPTTLLGVYDPPDLAELLAWFLKLPRQRRDPAALGALATAAHLSQLDVEPAPPVGNNVGRYLSRRDSFTLEWGLSGTFACGGVEVTVDWVNPNRKSFSAPGNVNFVYFVVARGNHRRVCGHRVTDGVVYFFEEDVGQSVYVVKSG